jgi:hypothetical protein
MGEEDLNHGYYEIGFDTTWRDDDWDEYIRQMDELRDYLHKYGPFRTLYILKAMERLQPAAMKQILELKF